MKKKQNTFNLNVFGRLVPVIKAANLTELSGNLAQYNYKTKQILFDPNQENISHTLLHELFHAVSDRLGWNQFLNYQAEEQMAESFSQILIDNFVFTPKTGQRGGNKMPKKMEKKAPKKKAPKKKK